MPWRVRLNDLLGRTLATRMLVSWLKPEVSADLLPAMANVQRRSIQSDSCL